MTGPDMNHRVAREFIGMARSRMTISWLMLLVLVSAIGFWSLRSGGSFLRDSLPYYLAALFAAFSLGSYVFGVVVGAIRVHERQRIADTHETEPADLSGPGIPPEISTAFQAARGDLTSLGFTFCCSYVNSKSLSNAIGFVAVFQEESTWEIARIIGVIATVEDKRKVSITTVLSTEFTDGTEVLTTDRSENSVFPELGPPIHVFRFPDVGGLDRLLELHRALSRRFDGGRTRRDPIDGDPLAYQKRQSRRMRDHNLACGYHYLDTDLGVRRPTWKGTILMTLKLTWPGKPLRLAWHRIRAARLIRELEKSA